MKRSILITIVASLLLTPSLFAAKPVKVFVLAGQSNMEGKIQNPLLEHQAKKDVKTKRLFAPFLKDGEWVKRQDVFIKFLRRRGKLTMGYGSRGRTGAELAFGTQMGNHFDEPVLLIKAAWGGRSLYEEFRPPSAGLPAEEKLQEQLANRIKGVQRRNKKRKKKLALPTMADIKKTYGRDYRLMIREVRMTLGKRDELFPELKGRKLELAGFVWFQGWNDLFGGRHKTYSKNMKTFIRDVRKDLQAPKLPFVIAAMGQNGSKQPRGSMKAIQQAQLTVQDDPEFKGNVLAFRTDVLVDKAAEELYPTWRKNFEQWKLVGSDHPYHYLGSAIWFTRIGNEMAKAMLKLRSGK